MTSTLMCLSLLVFHEARAEPLKGKEAVMEVVMNRTKDSRYPSKPCDVIKQKSQFSWVNNPNNLRPPKYEIKAWEDSQKVAKDYLSKQTNGNYTNHTKGALYFNSSRLGVRFNKQLKCKIGKHVFF
ncbi:Cell wall hydrolyses involved in spore germination [Acinetobacter phage MD-2021a]|nr:Cell wall hydrolyses involved in spore germination [Acinetobacter phage MD-2021a]CAH1088708.1 Cell wall hydrolyses involved in spore germination [Acinetobacter phage MD-2021a]